MPGLIEQAPAGDGFGCQTSVREGDDQRRARLQHPRDLADHLAGTPEILDRAAQRRAVEFSIGKGQHRVAVQILRPPFVEKRVLGQGLAIDPDADDAAIGRLGRQMRDPARHDVENGAAGRQQLAVKIGDGGNRRAIDAGGRHVSGESGVGQLIDRQECGRRKESHGAVLTHHWLT